MKFVQFGLKIAVGIIVVLIGLGLFFPPTYSSRKMLPGTTSVLIAQLIPNSLSHSNEYDRRVVLNQEGKPDIKLELSPDTGGHKRADLFRLPSGHFLLVSDSEILEIDAQAHSIQKRSPRPRVETYLGAFDYDMLARKWRFFESSEGPAKF